MPLAATIASPPLAHVGHWYVSLLVFMGPVVLLAALVALSGARERRRRAAGASEESRVTTSEHGDRAVITVTGPLDESALVDIEAELQMASRRALRGAVLDLRNVTAVQERCAAGLAEAVDAVRPELDVAALPAPEPVQRALQRLGALAGIEIVDAERYRA